MEQEKSDEKYSTDMEILKNGNEVEKEYFRSSGHGGQNVNKRETAVRLRHLPSGEIVEVRHGERSRARNEEIAFERLRERLIHLNTPEKVREMTSVPKREKKKRRQEKGHRSEIKKSRKRPDVDID